MRWYLWKMPTKSFARTLIYSKIARALKALKASMKYLCYPLIPLLIPALILPLIPKTLSLFWYKCIICKNLDKLFWHRRYCPNQSNKRNILVFLPYLHFSTYSFFCLLSYLTLRNFLPKKRWKKPFFFHLYCNSLEISSCFSF